jgi:hypothetical protein
VQGGTNFWKDLPEKYQVTETHELINKEESGIDKGVLHFETAHEQATLFRYSVSCHNPGDRYKMSRPHRFNIRIT